VEMMWEWRWESRADRRYLRRRDLTRRDATDLKVEILSGKRTWGIWIVTVRGVRSRHVW